MTQGLGRVESNGGGDSIAGDASRIHALVNHRLSPV
jgi:hypothetical protein